jgi:alginate O-acetyltransferase complex protein AlgJ
MKQQLPPSGIWLNRFASFLLTILVLGTLCAPALVHLTGNATDPTFIYNRQPSPLPDPPTTIGRLGKFRDNFIKYVEDNFGLRAELVRLNVLVNSWLGVSSVPGLLIGKDRWYFLKADYASLDQFRGLNRFSDQELDAWIDAAEGYRDWLEAQGIAFMVVFAPNQQTVYPEHMPAYATRVWPETRLDQVSRRLRERRSRVAWIDLRASLWSARSLGLLYNKYESHWNALGAFVAYSAIMQPVGKMFPGANTLTIDDFTIGSSRSRWNIPPLMETFPVLSQKRPSRVTATEVVASVNNQPVTKVTTDIESGPSVMVYGDSFAEPGLQTYFNQSFRSTMFVATNHSPFPGDLIKKHRPDLVIFELVERYLARPFDISPKFVSEVLRRDAPSYTDVTKAIGVIGGFVDGARHTGDTVEFSGWAVDKETNAPARAIYAFYGDVAVGAAKLSDLRPDVTRGMTDHKAGFRITVPNDLDLRDPNRRLRFFSTNASNKIYELAINPPLLPGLVQLFKEASK